MSWVHWTIRLALICYAMVVLARLLGLNTVRSRAAVRCVWTLGCLLFVAHVAAAFHFVHDWSHAKAMASTAKQTRELIGIEFGEGLYFSYLFTLLWVLDAARMWFVPEHRLWGLTAAAPGFQLYLFFIAFNGAVIFEDGVTRPAGIVVTVLMAVVLWWRRSRHSG